MSMRREEFDNEGTLYSLWRCQAIERPPEAGFGTNSCVSLCEPSRALLVRVWTGLRIY